jgi:3'-phosphoadenosine 5'-phosphosulfate sulfotransferase (PAPS reductase)/FAD synthetase
MFNIVSFSGGKDSTCMLLKMILEWGYKVDEVIMFDTEWEFPEMYKHIKKVEDFLSIKITKIRDERGFNYLATDYILKKGKNKGQRGYGWPNSKIRWCTSRKRDLIRSYLKKNYSNYNLFVGINSNEQKRTLKNKEANYVYPLVENRIGAKDCLEYCYSKGFNWNGLYEHLDRVSCMYCPLTNFRTLRYIINHRPEIWKQIKDLEKKTFNNFKDKGCLHYENRFKNKCHKDWNKVWSVYES